MTSYPKYLQSDWWAEINYRYIGQSPKACCWICKGRRALLLHHVSYENLYREKLGRDVYIVCFRCHTRIHFKITTGEKVKLETTILLKRMRWLRATHKLRTFRLGSLINNIARMIASAYSV